MTVEEGKSMMYYWMRAKELEGFFKSLGGAILARLTWILATVAGMSHERICSYVCLRRFGDPTVFLFTARAIQAHVCCGVRGSRDEERSSNGKLQTGNKMQGPLRSRIYTNGICEAAFAGFV